MANRVCLITFASLLLSCSLTVRADPECRPKEPKEILIKNVDIFDGKEPNLKKGWDVLVEGNLIKQLAAEIDRPECPEIDLPPCEEIAPPECVKIEAGTNDGEPRVLMPGMIDAHWHSFLAVASRKKLMRGDAGYLHTAAAVGAEATLMRGFTTVRDLASPAFGLKTAIDEGLLPGPRIYPSGVMISQTSGHGDYRLSAEKHRRFGGALSLGDDLGIGLVADGVDEVLAAVRDQLRQGAAQIKLAAGGGVASDYDPLDVTQYTKAELEAAVEAASHWGTYVTVHAYTPEAISQAVDAEVKCIEHGHLIDETTMLLLAKKGIWLSAQPFGERWFKSRQEVFKNSPSNVEKARKVFNGTKQLYTWAKKYGVKLAFGTDKNFGAGYTQSADLVEMRRLSFSSAEILKMATSSNGELLRLSGPRDPYPGCCGDQEDPEACKALDIEPGREACQALGVIEKGAYADLLIVDGNPLNDSESGVELLVNPKLLDEGCTSDDGMKLEEDDCEETPQHELEAPPEKLLLIMKNGVIVKNTLP